jgi:sugar/nucleoside kinase (ribokinase family)
MGCIGNDPAGEAVLREFDAEGIDTSHLQVIDGQPTSYSTVLLAETGERTILNYSGVKIGEQKLIDTRKISGDWLYVSSMGGPISLLHEVITMAAKKGMKIAFNPGSRELNYPDKIRALLDDITLLILNKDEMQLIVEGRSMEELARHAAHYVDYAVVTDGPKGVVAVGAGKVVIGGMYKEVKVVDRLGAGDAFGSGFTAMLAQGKSLEEAVIFASANSTSVVQYIGAKEGILSAHAKLQKMPLAVKSL